MKTIRCLSGAELKHIAMVCMLADHLNKAIITPALAEVSCSWLLGLRGLLHVLGRFAFPIFSFLLVEGFYYTRNRWKYFWNLVLFAILSEIPYDLFIASDWVYTDAQNIFFTLALSLAVIWLIDSFKNNTRYWAFFVFLITAVGCLLAVCGRVDYGSYGILVSLAFYLFRFRPLVASIVGYFVLHKQIWSFPAFLLTTLYNGQRGKQYKWFNYWFYPLHLLILEGIRWAVKL